jgi:DNA-binding NarL/FixJ family response regulator
MSPRSSRKNLSASSAQAQKARRSPRTIRAPRHAESQPPIGSALAPFPIRVLCVEDHAVLVEGLKAQFAIDGEIEIVGRLATAARLSEEVERLRPHVVMLDIEMPGPDAFEMADRVKRSHPNVRVVVLSAHIRDAFVSASFAAGAEAYFAKSDELDDIVRGIHAVMHNKGKPFILGPKVRERCSPPAPRRGSRAIAALNREEPSRARPATRLARLTVREAEILRLIGRGLSRVQIAAQLCRSAKTIDGHQTRMMKKLGIPMRADLMRFAIREGLAQA